MVKGYYCRVKPKKYDDGEQSEKHFIIQPDETEYMLDGTEPYIYDVSSAIEIDPATLGQSTGLKDKNGKEIYEGDILLNDDNVETMPNQKSVVKWLPGHFVAGGILGAGDHIGEDCQVIGNIHQHKELLEANHER